MDSDESDLISSTSELYTYSDNTSETTEDAMSDDTLTSNFSTCTSTPSNSSLSLASSTLYTPLAEDTDSSDDSDSSSSLCTRFDVTAKHHQLSKFAEIDPTLTKTLYQGGEMTVLESYILLMQYSLRHSLSKAAFSELLKVVSVHLPHSSLCCESLYVLQSKFQSIFADLKPKTYEYCSTCHAPASPEKAICSCSSRCSGQFIYIPVAPQLRRRIEGMHY